jgi:Peptidase S46
MRSLAHPAAWSCVVALAISARCLPAEEGKWTPQQVLQLDAQWLKHQGLELPVSRLWNPQRGTGLLSAAIAVPGCSASFVSANGLILTNHHCLFSMVQEHSTSERDLITNGFLARTQAEELASKTMRVTVPRRFTDVTREIESAVPTNADDAARSKAIEAKEKSLVAACEKTQGSRCSVAAFDGGLSYALVETFELTDIRLVYAPPRAIGEFGGEPDNFRWPRHTGDFSIARAYKDGKPYRPEFFFPLSPNGVKPGDFVMVLGYPGRTFRAMTAGEMENERRRFELVQNVYGEWIRSLEDTTKGSADGSIAVAAGLKSLNNAHTNAEGQLAGLARGRLIEKQKAHDDEVVAWAAKRPQFAKSLAAKKELDRLASEREHSLERDYVFGLATAGSVALKDAIQLTRLAVEREKPDAERAPGYQQRDWARLRAAMERDQKSFYRPADEALLRSWIARAQQQGIAAAKGLDVTRLYASTRVTDLRERLKMLDETPSQLKARADPFLDFAFAYEPERRAWQATVDERDGAIARLRPEWRKAVLAFAAKPVAPDANSTLRVSFAHVKGYSPRDGVFYEPQTTLAGMIEKNTGQEPFAVPSFILEAAKQTNAARIPIDFLADADTTGGNSGSPVVNGRGEIVGINFDRPWENVANDFGYNPDVARNISVDIRFLDWMLEDVQKAEALAQELGLKRSPAKR